MNRAVILAGAVAALALAACGGGAAASSSSPSPSGAAQGGGRFGGGRNGSAGELVQINGQKLILNTSSGDATVQYSGQTVFTRTSTGTVADIVTGTCITATGQKDTGGAVTASTVRVSAPRNGACGGGTFPGAGNGAPRRSPEPSGAPTPPPNAAFVRGQVTGVSGTQVTVKDAAGSTTITVPTTVQVSRTDVIAASDLAIGDCVAAIGTKDSSGTVAARTITVVPSGPSGCFTGGGFGRGRGGFGGGGFGGGGFGGGGFGGGDGAPPGA